jgi:hypothetical protein
VSCASLIETYIGALPFTAVAVVAVPGGGCRVAVGGEPVEGEKIKHRFYFKPLHIELVLGAAGLGDGPIDDAPAGVAELIERAARRMHAPYETAAEIRAAAKLQVAAVQARVAAMNQNGGLTQINKQYRAYRLAQVAKAEPAVSYAVFLERRYTATIVRQVAASGRMI